MIGFMTSAIFLPFSLNRSKPFNMSCSCGKNIVPSWSRYFIWSCISWMDLSNVSVSIFNRRSSSFFQSSDRGFSFDCMDRIVSIKFCPSSLRYFMRSWTFSTNKSSFDFPVFAFPPVFSFESSPLLPLGVTVFPALVSISLILLFAVSIIC